MQIASHEAYDLHELLVSCVNTIVNMGHFLNVVQDQELKSIIERHYPLHVRDYNLKLEYFQNQQGPTQGLQVPELNANLPSFTNSPVGNFPSVTPRTDVDKFNDREIATAYLLTLKRAGREYAWAAMEAANPGLRTLFENAFIMSSHHAYDVWQWMVKKGYYPVEPASQNTINTISQIYHTVEQPVGVM